MHMGQASHQPARPLWPRISAAAVAQRHMITMRLIWPRIKKLCPTGTTQRKHGHKPQAVPLTNAGSRPAPFPIWDLLCAPPTRRLTSERPVPAQPS